ncbi:CHAT domain-containing protein [Dactylosporangium sp. CA-233914]|uniref:CHAT domain-containing protein n=1 Tax=Dactylosporangium sp. CA-233914 TaxID=3239934 RepID=UPI003D9215D8
MKRTMMTTPDDQMAPESPLLPWFFNEPELRRIISSDGQIYLRDPRSGEEWRLESVEGMLLRGDDWLEPATGKKKKEETETEAEEDWPFDEMVIVRHLDRERWRCADCATESTMVYFSWIERRCPSCWSFTVDVVEAETVPPRPAQFGNIGLPPLGIHNVLENYDHVWGASANDDAKMLWKLSNAYGRERGGYPHLYLLMLLAESLVGLPAHQTDPYRFNLVLNVGNVVQRYFRVTGSAYAARAALDAFERAAGVDEDSVPRSLALHSFAMAVVAILDVYDEDEAGRITDRPDLRRRAIEAAREAASLAEMVAERDPEGAAAQLFRIRYALADLLRGGTPSDADLDAALELLDGLDMSLAGSLATDVTAARLETRLALRPPAEANGDIDPADGSEQIPDEGLEPWIAAANELHRLVLAGEPGKIGHRWRWSLAIGRFLTRLGAIEEAQPHLKSAVTYVKKDTAFEVDPVALAGDAERLYQAFNVLATNYTSIGWAFEGLALLETYRGKVLEMASLTDEGRAVRMIEAEREREEQYFGGMFGPDDTPTLRMVEERAGEEVTGRRFGQFDDDYALPGLAERVDELLARLADEPSALMSLSMDRAGAEVGVRMSAVVIRPPGTPEPRFGSHTWTLDDDQVAALRSQLYRRPGSFREKRLHALGRTMFDCLLAPLAGQLDGFGCTRALVVMPSALSNLPIEAARPAAGTDGSAPGPTIPHVAVMPAFTFGSGTAAKERHPGEERLLIIGYNGEDLHFVDAEAAALRDLFGDRATYLPGAECTKRLVVEHLNGGFDFVHLICHGTYDDRHPLESSLHFSVRREVEAFRLRAREIETMVRFPRRPVISLSACSTALTAESRSNTWNGLPGALLRAGAHALIGTRWPIRDEAAAAMMVDYYRRVRHSGASALQCFLAMQDDERRRGRAEDWASFGYLGQP